MEHLQEQHYLSIEKKVQAQLEQGKKVSVLSILRDFGTIDGRKIISNLRNHLVIVGEPQKVKRGRPFNLYYLHSA